MDTVDLAMTLCYNDEVLNGLKNECNITISLDLLKEINNINPFVIDELLCTEFKLDMHCDDEEGCYFPEARGIFEFLCTIYDTEDLCAKILENKALWKKFLHMIDCSQNATPMFKNKIEQLYRAGNMATLVSFMSSSSRMMFLLDEETRDSLYDYVVQENMTEDVTLMQSLFFFDYLFKKGWRPEDLKEAIYIYLLDSNTPEETKTRIDTIMQYPDIADFVSKITIGWYLADLQMLGYELTEKQQEIVLKYQSKNI